MDEVQTYEWTNVTQILYIHINSYKFMCQMCFQCMILMHEMYELQMNEFCMISIIKLWDVKFVMMGENALSWSTF